jgi:hypothetical protein
VITTASGKGARLGMGEWTDDDLITDVEHPTPSAALVVNDWFWGGGAPDATLIPWTWLSMPMAFRADQPINSAAITGGNTAIATATAAASVAAYGNFPVSGNLSSILPGDAASYAAMLIAYYANPLLRCPTWTLDLTQRTADEEKWRILGREIGDRVTLTASTLIEPVTGKTTILPVPAALPPGVVSLVIEGISHDSSPFGRVTTWTTSPLLGAAPGVEGPWFRTDTSRTDGTDVSPF